MCKEHHFGSLGQLREEAFMEHRPMEETKTNRLTMTWPHFHTCKYVDFH